MCGKNNSTHFNNDKNYGPHVTSLVHFLFRTNKLILSVVLVLGAATPPDNVNHYVVLYHFFKIDTSFLLNVVGKVLNLPISCLVRRHNVTIMHGTLFIDFCPNLVFFLKNI